MTIFKIEIINDFCHTLVLKKKLFLVNVKIINAKNLDYVI